MRLTIALFLFLFHSSGVLSQNLVPNSSFEEINDTIGRFTENNIEFTSKIKNWTTPNTTSPDLITPDFKEKYIIPPPPHSGLNMIGIQFNKKEWVECVKVNLLRELIPNRTYYVEFWIRRSFCLNPQMNVDQKMNENFGILFSSDSIKTSNGNMLIGNPQVRLDTQLLITDKEWVKVSTYFTPKTKCNNLYLGQFQQKGEAPKIKMGYYVIDDVLVEEVTDFETIKNETELPIGSIIPLNNVHFKTGTTELANTESYAILKELARYLKSYLKTKIRINGHTDSTGSEKSNLLLSKRRAKYIARSIIEYGVSKDRIKWKGFGEEHPIADNKYEEGRSKNRRVEFEVIE